MCQCCVWLGTCEHGGQGSGLRKVTFSAAPASHGAGHVTRHTAGHPHISAGQYLAVLTAAIKRLSRAVDYVRDSNITSVGYVEHLETRDADMLHVTRNYTSL